jgi:hypothetical protein
VPMDFVHAPACTPGDAKLATIKINVDPSPASVFVDGHFVGHVGDFGVFGASHADRHQSPAQTEGRTED